MNNVNSLHGLSHYFFQHFHEVDTVIIPILQTRKLRSVRLSLYAPDDTVQNVENQDLNLGF